MGIEYTADRARIDFGLVHAWLAGTYWSPGIPRALVERAFAASTAICAAFVDEAQVGVARVVSDTVRFAYLADVYVVEAHRGRGIARGMTGFLMALPVLAETEGWLLQTNDAHGVYAGLGFRPHPNPDRVMTLKRSRPW